MKINIRSLICFAAIIIGSIGFISCSKDEMPEPEPGPSPGIPENIIKANSFFASYMYDGYLWNNKIPLGIKPEQEADPFKMVDKMIYKEFDRWTYISDDAESVFNDFKGVSTTYGYSIILGEFSNTKNYFAIIKYVVPGSPAEKAGLKRGNIIFSFANGDITEKNYKDLYYAPNITIKLGKVENKVISPIEGNISMTAVEMYEDPINAYKVVEANGKKIGYLAYTGFLKESHKKLDDIFTTFKNSGVAEVVLDLRYNPGGNAVTPPYLGSFMAPESIVKAGSVFLKEQWNTSYMDYFQKKGDDTNVYFNKDNVANLNLNRVFVLTTKGTASASEATISGLMPYIKVIKIGTTTHGKYCGAGLYRPTIDNKGTVDPLIKNWMISMVIFKFVNKDGFTDFKDGIAPDYEVKDDLFNAYQFGDTKDPHFAKAISIITGTPASASKATMQKSTLIEGVDYVMKPNLTDILKKDYGNTKIMFCR
ncbi:MAG: S41 family peptidase [Bacteroidales bacterium]